MVCKYGQLHQEIKLRCPQNASKIWKGTYEAFTKIQPQIKWRFGDGKKCQLIVIISTGHAIIHLLVSIW